MTRKSKKRAALGSEMPRYQRRVLDAISELTAETGQVPTLARIGQRIGRSPKYVYTVKRELVASGCLLDERYKHRSIEITELGHEILKRGRR